MATDDKIKTFMDKIKNFEKGHKLDLSSDEDLSIAIMNLISIEEHLFFSAEKTGKTKYYDFLFEIREMRKELLKKIIKEYEGEVWCISKHLLASSMRLMEVGTKALTKGDKKEAYDLFKKSHNLYNLFWALNLKLVDDKDLKKINLDKKDEPILKQENTFFNKFSGVINKILDCCRE